MVDSAITHNPTPLMASIPSCGASSSHPLTSRWRRESYALRLLPSLSLHSTTVSASMSDAWRTPAVTLKHPRKLAGALLLRSPAIPRSAIV